MAITSRRVLDYPFHSRLSRFASLALGVALLWFGSGQLTVAGLVLMFSGLVMAVSAVQRPQPRFRSPDGGSVTASHYQADTASLKPAGYR